VSVEILRLECVLERSALRVTKAIEAVLRREGWRLATDEPHPAAREIRVGARNGAVVIDEVDGDGLLAVPWALYVTRELGCDGISMRAEPDLGSFQIARYSAGETTGSASFDGSRDTKRKPLKLAFLTDLVDDAATRGRLTRGLAVPPLGETEALYAIARHAGLPKPMARGETLARATALRFLPPLRVRGAREATVRFETTFHVRGLESSVVAHALTAILKKKRRAVTTSKTPSRQLFVTAAGDWVSFGEILHDDPLHVRWGEALSRHLGREVLEVWTDGERAARLVTWQDGREAGRVSLPGDFVRTNPRDPTRISLETAALAPFRPKRKVVRLGREEFSLAVWVGAVRAMVVALGETVDLPRPILDGRLEGTILSFGRP
jgi:hypothetical protein